MTVLGRSPTAPEATPPATATGTEAADVPVGDLPIIGDPIRDLTIWWSNRLSDANEAGLASLRGRFLTIHPLTDDTVRNLYGKILLITIPLLTLGGVILGYLIMVSRTSGESAYTERAVTPRFVVGATLSVFGTASSRSSAHARPPARQRTLRSTTASGRSPLIAQPR